MTIYVYDFLIQYALHAVGDPSQICEVSILPVMQDPRNGKILSDDMNVQEVLDRGLGNYYYVHKNDRISQFSIAQLVRPYQYYTEYVTVTVAFLQQQILVDPRNGYFLPNQMNVQEVLRRGLGNYYYVLVSANITPCMTADFIIPSVYYNQPNVLNKTAFFDLNFFDLDLYINVTKALIKQQSRVKSGYHDPRNGQFIPKHMNVQDVFSRGLGDHYCVPVTEKLTQFTMAPLIKHSPNWFQPQIPPSDSYKDPNKYSTVTLAYIKQQDFVKPDFRDPRNGQFIPKYMNVQSVINRGLGNHYCLHVTLKATRFAFARLITPNPRWYPGKIPASEFRLDPELYTTVTIAYFKLQIAS